MTTTLELARALSDPAPPVAGRAAHAAVRARATQIRNRRRVASAFTAVTCVALLAIAVSVLTAAGSSRGVDVAAPPAGAQVDVDVTGDLVPDGVDLDATLVGDGGTFHARVRTPGAFSFGAVPPGDYELRWEWANDDGTAAAAGHRAVHVETDDSTLTLTL